MPEKILPIPSVLPVYPLREKVVFPNMVVQMYLQPGEMAILDEAVQSNRFLGLASCLTFADPCRFEDVAKVGTVCRIDQILRLPEGGAKIVVEGLTRIQIISPIQREPFFLAMVEVVEEAEPEGLIPDALMQSVGALLKIALAYGRPLPEDVVKMVDKIGDAGRLADLIAVYLDLDWREQQKLLENLNPLERLKDVYLHLISEVQSLQLKEDIQSGVGKRLGQHQKEFLLREQLKQIQEELGEDDPRQAEINELKNGIAKADMPENVRIVAEKELARLQRTNPASPEYTVSRAYLDCLCGVPWNRGTKDTLDIEAAQQILDEDHYDLKEVKERILELLAVRSLKASTKGPILCFVGPPGVGKTSLGRSIARAMGRKFIRMSLGGMKDEAELRGHRRTYIGAMPGRIIKEICRAESNNPVFMLDEVDKIGQDFRGDPASALLEALDPEQNFSFTDHYLDVPFDLSKVMFITTANLLDPVPNALRDRMEVITLSGYSDEEKKQIAFKYLIPKQVQENGLETYSPDFEETAVDKIIADYTREAGVRNLERKIASICRKIGKEITQHKPPRILVTPQDVEALLGPRKFFSDVASGEDRVGVVTGLAWTEAGGDIIFVEASRMVGKKELILTGSLGDVMQESAKTALSFVRAHAADFGIAADFFENSDIHIHVPAGAIPKDGPSAGITIAIALISLLTGSPARRDVAMSGELTLSGRILPVGGIKEKVLAARRAGVTTILLPEQNRVNLQDIDEDIREEMNILFVDNIGDLAEKTLLSERGKALKGFFSSKPSNTFSAPS